MQTSPIPEGKKNEPIHAEGAEQRKHGNRVKGHGSPGCALAGGEKLAAQTWKHTSERVDWPKKSELFVFH